MTKGIMRWIGLGLVVALAVMPFGVGAAVTGRVTATIQMEDIRSVGGANTVARINDTTSISFTNGTGINQVTDCVSTTASVTTGNTDIQLDALTGPFGAVALVAVKVVKIDLAAATANVTFSRPATSGAGIFDADADAITLKPGGLFLWVDPSATGTGIVNGDTDVLRLVAASGTQSVVVTVCGEV